MKAAIIDDEASARQVLRLLLKDCAPDIQIVAEADNYDYAIDILQTIDLSVVFLDIDLGTHSGFDVLDALGEKHKNLSVIFTTSYSEHALKAFKYAAVDYLLKPVIPEELAASIERVVKSSTSFSALQLQMLKKEMVLHKEHVKKRNHIIVKGYNGSLIIAAADIHYCKGEGSYTKIVQKDGTTITASRPLHHFEEQLSDLPHFIRVHKSYIANLNEIKFISKKETSQICFNNDVCIPITNYKEVWDLLE